MIWQTKVLSQRHGKKNSVVYKAFDVFLYFAHPDIEVMGWAKNEYRLYGLLCLAGRCFIVRAEMFNMTKTKKRSTVNYLLDRTIRGRVLNLYNF